MVQVSGGEVRRMWDVVYDVDSNKTAAANSKLQPVFCKACSHCGRFARPSLKIIRK